MLPKLLAELKRRGYRVVHVVPATAELPKTVTTPDQWLMRETAVATQIPLPPIPPRPRVTAPASIDVVPPTTTKLPETLPTAPATPAAKTSPGPRAEITDVTGAIKTDPGPVTTSNMPKVGIP
jgi:hypothetical protein